jgi:hypothetical protein
MIKPNKRVAVFAAIISMSAVFYGVVTYSEYKPVSAASYQQAITSAAAATPENVINPGLVRAQIALGEYEKKVRERTANCNCGDDVEKYTESLRIQWCASFVSWVSKEANTPLGTDASWRIGKAQDIARYLEKNGTWVSAEQAKEQNLQPQVGDIVIYWRGHFEDNLGHADIVIATDPNKPGQATLIGGNIQNKVSLRENFYYSEHYGFLGFGRP